MKIAHNPETGEYLGLQGGEWKPLKMAQNEAGERLYLDGDAWQPLPGWKKQEPSATLQAEATATPTQPLPQAADAPSAPAPVPAKPQGRLDLGDAYENLGIDPEDVPDISGAAGYVSETMSNVPRSAKELAQGLAGVVLHPGQTIDNLGNIVLGFKEKGAKLLNPEEAPGEHEKYADAVNQMVSDRYGSIDKAAKTFRDDPVGFALDASMLLGGGGALLKGAGAAGKAAGAANVGANIAKAGEVLTKAGQVADPLTTLSYLAKPVTAPARAAAARAAEFFSPERIYERAAKIPPRSISKRDRDLAIEAALRERIPISQEGLAKAERLRSEIGGAVRDELRAPEYAGKRIDPATVAEIAETDVMPGIYSQVNRADDLAAAGKVFDNFYDAYKRPMTLEQAHDIKTGTYQNLNKRAWDERQGAGPETEKALARALRMQIDEAAPAVRAMNKRLSGLIALADELPNTLNRTGNHSIINMAGAGGAGGALGGFIGGPIGAGVGGALGVALRSPRVQSEIAFALDAARKGYRASAPVRRWMKKAGIPAKYGAYVEARYGGLIGEMERSR